LSWPGLPVQSTLPYKHTTIPHISLFSMYPGTWATLVVRLQNYFAVRSKFKGNALWCKGHRPVLGSRPPGHLVLQPRNAERNPCEPHRSPALSFFLPKHRRPSPGRTLLPHTTLRGTALQRVGEERSPHRLAWHQRPVGSIDPLLSSTSPLALILATRCTISSHHSAHFQRSRRRRC
jgi:hypothetical protein